MNKRKGLSHPTVAIKNAVIERDGGRCVLALPRCTGQAQTTDHIANRQQGGSRILNDPANLVGACTICNGDKADASGETLAELEERGLYVRSGATHAATLAKVKATLVRYPDGKRYRLIDEHTRELVTHRGEN